MKRNLIFHSVSLISLLSSAIAIAAVEPAAKPVAPKNPVSSAFNCSDLRRAALKISVHASNIANRNTTRTPEGGPYQRQEVTCKVASGAFCNVEKTSDKKIVLAPSHPDADQSGYVTYPDINVGAEWAGVNTAASELKLLSAQGICGTKSLAEGSTVLIKYDPDFEDVMSDTISFRADGRVSSWSRTAKTGKSQSLTFQEDGTPVGL